MKITVGLLNNIVNHQLNREQNTCIFEEDTELATITDKQLLYLQQQRIIGLEAALKTVNFMTDLTDQNHIVATCIGGNTETPNMNNVVVMSDYVRDKSSK